MLKARKSNESKLLKNHGKMQLSQKNEFFMDNAQFYVKCHSREVVN